MAVTKIGVDSPLTAKAWSKKLSVEVSKATDIFRLMGEGQNNIIQLKDETQKGPGDRVTYGLRCQLMGSGVSENETLEGNEEALALMSDSLVINELAHAVRVKNDGTIDQQRVPFSLREEASDGIRDWYSDRISLMAFLHFCGYTAPKISFEGRQLILNDKFWGFNTPQGPSQNNIIRPHGKTSDESLDEKDGFSLKLIDMAVERAKTANPKIRPVLIGGERVYVMYLHPYQVTSLRTNTENGQWLDIQKAAYSGSRGKNPIFDGSLGMYNGVVLREAEHITSGVSSKNTPVENTRRAVLLGAQAGMIAFGRNRGASRYNLTEELFDYKRELGIAVKTLIGFKKTRFAMPNSSLEAQDFGTIVVSTYAKKS